MLAGQECYVSVYTRFLPWVNQAPSGIVCCSVGQRCRLPMRRFHSNHTAVPIWSNHPQTAAVAFRVCLMLVDLVAAVIRWNCVMLANALFSADLVSKEAAEAALEAYAEVGVWTYWGKGD